MNGLPFYSARPDLGQLPLMDGLGLDASPCGASHMHAMHAAALHQVPQQGCTRPTCQQVFLPGTIREACRITRHPDAAAAVMFSFRPTATFMA